MRLVLRWLAIFSRVDQYSNRLNASDDQRLDVEPAERARLAGVAELEIDQPELWAKFMNRQAELIKKGQRLQR